MRLELEPKEAVILRDILDGYLSQLRMDISNTERYELREAMKNEENIVKGLLARLEKVTTPSA